MTQRELYRDLPTEQRILLDGLVCENGLYIKDLINELDGAIMQLRADLLTLANTVVFDHNAHTPAACMCESCAIAARVMEEHRKETT